MRSVNIRRKFRALNLREPVKRQCRVLGSGPCRYQNSSTSLGNFLCKKKRLNERSKEKITIDKILHILACNAEIAKLLENKRHVTRLTTRG